MKPFKKHILAIGGLDPSGHAGILVDARVFERCKIPYWVTLTALTAQSRTRFFGFEAISKKLFARQLQGEESIPGFAKLGMLGHARLAKPLLDWLSARPRVVFLWDPVYRSSTGGLLLKPPHFNAALLALLRRCDVFTPNLPEAEWILGRKIRGTAQAEAAAFELFAMGRRPGRMVVLKGGHSGGNECCDWIVREGKLRRLRTRRRAGSRRGTGCTFGAALLAGLHRGLTPERAAAFAKRYVLTQLIDAPAP